jgi:hypothetical protein
MPHSCYQTGLVSFPRGLRGAREISGGSSRAVGFVTAASLTRASERTVTSHRVWQRSRRFRPVIALLERSVRCRSLTAGR